MARCLELAAKGAAFVAPNPQVGCVIVHRGSVVAEGYHHYFGGDHAEVDAIKQLPAHIPPAECTLYVNLEPCSHEGKTPPCANLIISKKFNKVVVGCLDPNPVVSGTGIEKLKQAGIEVIVGVLEAECTYLNRKFIHYFIKHRPFVCLKWAQTNDGYMGRNQDQMHLGSQISHEECRPLVHQLRAEHMGIVIGANTANKDNPLLDTRYYTGRNPVKIIVSINNTVNKSLKLFKEGKTWVYNSFKQEIDGEIEYIQLKHRHFLEQMLTDLYERGVQSILVEGGSQLLQSFIDLQLWDEAYKIVAPVTWGRGIPAPVFINREQSSRQIADNTVYHYLVQ